MRSVLFFILVTASMIMAATPERWKREELVQGAGGSIKESEEQGWYRFDVREGGMVGFWFEFHKFSTTTAIYARIPEVQPHPTRGRPVL